LMDVVAYIYTVRTIKNTHTMALKILFPIFIIFFHYSLVKAQGKPQIIVLTDIGGDTDDEQSLVRFLYYADHFDIKAICATGRLGHGQDTKPEIIQAQINAYREVYTNLLLHSNEFPDPDYLETTIK